MKPPDWDRWNLVDRIRTAVSSWRAERPTSRQVLDLLFLGVWVTFGAQLFLVEGPWSWFNLPGFVFWVWAWVALHGYADRHNKLRRDVAFLMRRETRRHWPGPLIQIDGDPEAEAKLQREIDTAVALLGPDRVRELLAQAAANTGVPHTEVDHR